MTKRLIGSKTLVISACLLLFGCEKLSQNITPQIQYSVQDRYLKALPSPFSELSTHELETKWGTEYLIGLRFAKNLDLYRAITALRRAEILLPANEEMRKRELQYAVLLSYYLGRRYHEVERAFLASDLANVPVDFPPFHDLLVILYDTYLQLKENEKAEHILPLLHQSSPQTHQNLLLYTNLKNGDLASLTDSEDPVLKQLLKEYEGQKKSPKKAAFLNAVLPGAGYFYLGQISTAITALLVNGLFLAAAIYFFLRRPLVLCEKNFCHLDCVKAPGLDDRKASCINAIQLALRSSNRGSFHVSPNGKNFSRRALAAGIIFLSFEAGWYFGGIHGGISQTKLYNERVYEQLAKPIMNRQGLFPVYQLHYGF